jgi:dCMP deaminase
MKQKHIEIRKQQCSLIASASTCCRRKVGSVIVDSDSNVVVSEGYNGPPRNSDRDLCGGGDCLRDRFKVKSGTQNDVGCHHAEINAILNATRNGMSTMGKWLFTSCDPCLMCAKAIHHAGIVKVYAPLQTSIHQEGLNYLEQNEVKVECF